MMAYEYTDARDGTRWWVEGCRVYRITNNGTRVLDHDTLPAPPAPRQSWWRRLLAWLRGWL